MDKRRKLIVSAVVGIAALGGATAALAGGEAADTPITGSALERASAAALDHTGGGRVTETESGDEDAAYEVEVTMGDGSEVDVHLDNDFKFVDVPKDKEDKDDAAGDKD